MERVLAINLLGVDDGSNSEDWQDAYDEAIFQAKNFFLQNTLVPKLWKNKTDRLVQVHQALHSLNGNDSIDVADLPLKPRKFEDLKSYENAFYQQKLQVANANDVPNLKQALAALIEIELGYYHWVMEKTEHFDLLEGQEEYKLNHRIDREYLKLLNENRVESAATRSVLKAEAIRASKLAIEKI